MNFLNLILKNIFGSTKIYSALTVFVVVVVVVFQLQTISRFYKTSGQHLPFVYIKSSHFLVEGNYIILYSLLWTE